VGERRFVRWRSSSAGFFCSNRGITPRFEVLGGLGCEVEGDLRPVARRRRLVTVTEEDFRWGDGDFGGDCWVVVGAATGTTGDLTTFVEYCSNTFCRRRRYSSSLCVVAVRGNKEERQNKILEKAV
jgi:hypothetical protein